MWNTLYIIINLSLLCAVLASLTRYNHFVKNPLYSASTNNDPKEMIQTGGRLTERHLSYLSAAGYKSVLSVVYFPSNDTSYNNVNGSFPSTDYEKYLLETNYNMKMSYLASNLTIADAKIISDLMSELPKPLYVHCHVGWTASLFTLIHLYLTASSEYKIQSAYDIYQIGLELGFDYQATQNSVDLINGITSSTDVVKPPSIELTLASGESSYKSYYWSHRLGDSDNWYNAGQFLSSHVSAIALNGYKAIVSFRMNHETTTRVTSDDQHIASPVNNDEFSEEHGLYEISLEASVAMMNNVSHNHLPLSYDDASDWTVEQFEIYRPILRSIEMAYGPVLVHCDTGYRSAVYVLTYLAYNQLRCSDWVLSKANQIGFTLITGSDDQAINFIRDVLAC
jgi:protein tyrosine phosphatase (PTP) superfamily phosphohydrolase (DUF442 family)